MPLPVNTNFLKICMEDLFFDETHPMFNTMAPIIAHLCRYDPLSPVQRDDTICLGALCLAYVRYLKATHPSFKLP